jgi:hypothetical protein
MSPGHFVEDQKGDDISRRCRICSAKGNAGLELVGATMGSIA